LPKISDSIYSVNKRSGVCSNSSTTFDFEIVQELRPITFSEPTATVICGNDGITELNLFDLLEFTTENGLLSKNLILQ